LPKGVELRVPLDLDLAVVVAFAEMQMIYPKESPRGSFPRLHCVELVSKGIVVVVVVAAAAVEELLSRLHS